MTLGGGGKEDGGGRGGGWIERKNGNALGGCNARGWGRRWGSGGGLLLT